MTSLKNSLIFNPQGDDSLPNREMWKGNPTNILDLNKARYNWALPLYDSMREKFWIPAKYSVSGDLNCYPSLSNDERRAYKGILSFLVFLDSIQAKNLPIISNPISAPEIRLCLGEQTSQELMHGKAYSVMIEGIIPFEEREQAYYFWRNDKVLLDRCSYITSIYQDYDNRSTEETYFLSILADYILESLYFYQGFCFFYSLAMRGLMGDSSDMIRKINEDEYTHIVIFQRLVTEGMRVFPHSKDQIYEMFSKASEHEILWNNHITNDNILGINSESIKNYSYYLTNLRLRAIGLNNLYPDTKNPYIRYEKFADVGSDGDTKGNYFEAGVAAYQKSEALEWDDF